jgi:hypothetical protein
MQVTYSRRKQKWLKANDVLWFVMEMPRLGFSDAWTSSLWLSKRSAVCVAFGSFDVACSIKEQPHKKCTMEAISDLIQSEMLRFLASSNLYKNCMFWVRVFTDCWVSIIERCKQLETFQNSECKNLVVRRVGYSATSCYNIWQNWPGAAVS